MYSTIRFVLLTLLLFAINMPSMANEAATETLVKQGDLLVIEVIPEKKPSPYHVRGKPLWHTGKNGYLVGKTGRICVCASTPFNVIGMSPKDIKDHINEQLVEFFGPMEITLEICKTQEPPDFSTTTSLSDTKQTDPNNFNPRTGWRIFEEPSQLNPDGWAIVGLLQLGDVMPIIPRDEDKSLQYIRLTTIRHTATSAFGTYGVNHQLQPPMVTGATKFRDIPGGYSNYPLSRYKPTTGYSENLIFEFDYKAAGFNKPTVLVMYRQVFPGSNSAGQNAFHKDSFGPKWEKTAKVEQEKLREELRILSKTALRLLEFGE